MKVLSEERKYSAQDFERLPEGFPYYQLIEGELITSPAPSYSHQRTVGRVFLKLSRLLEEKGLEVYERAGVKEYWPLDPNRKTFEIYKNTEDGFKLSSQAREKGKVLSEIFGLEVDLKDIYEGGI